jgi:spore maturation protein CgeB
VVGDWHSELHEETASRALRRLGHEVVRFPWHHYFKPTESPTVPVLTGILLKAQNKLIAGPIVDKINKDFVSSALSHKPDAIFIYRGTHITARTLQAIKKALPGTVLVGYNNDDPFAGRQPRLLWRHFLSAIPVYDLVLAYRTHNLHEFKRAGAQRVELLRSWFDPERNYPVELTAADNTRFGCDVVFVGHYEDDGRTKMLEAIANAGLDVKLFGPGYDWDPVIRKSRLLSHLAPVQLVWGNDYNKALCGAKIALCFLSKLNRDTYTRRCFEIPATGTLMVSEYTQDLANLYSEDEEAVFFRSSDELLNKLNLYAEDTGLRSRVAKGGFERVYRDGHDVVSRMRLVTTWIRELSSTIGNRNGN